MMLCDDVVSVLCGFLRHNDACYVRGEWGRIRRCVSYACRSGHRDLFVWAVQQGRSTVSACMQVRDVRMLAFVHRNGAQLDSCALNAAVVRGDLASVRYAYDNLRAWCNRTTTLAIKHGRVDILQFALDNGAEMPLDPVALAAEAPNGDMMDFLLERHGVSELPQCSLALGVGSEWLLQRALNADSWCDASTLASAARTCSVGMLRVLRAAGCPLSAAASVSAVQSGSLEVVRYLREQGCAWDANVFSLALQLDHLDIARYALKEKCALYETDKWLVAARGDVALFAAVCDALGPNSDVDRQVCAAAALAGNVKVLEHAHRQGFAFGPEVLHAGVERNHVAVVRYAVSHGLPFGPDLVRFAVVVGAGAALAFFLREGAATQGLCEVAARAQQAGSLRVLLHHGARADTDIIDIAALMGHVALLRALLDHGLVPNAHTLDMAAAVGSVPILKLLVEHGCVPTECTWICAASNDDVADFLEATERRGGKKKGASREREKPRHRKEKNTLKCRR